MFSKGAQAMLADQLQTWKTNKTLLTLKVVKAKGEFVVMHGRIVEFTHHSSWDGTILLYEDDLKRVENVTLSHIEEIYPSDASKGTIKVKPTQFSTERQGLVNGIKEGCMDLSLDELRLVHQLIHMIKVKHG